MTGTLTTPAGGTSLRFFSERLFSPAGANGSNRNNMSFANQNGCKASLHAAVIEAEPVTETRKKAASLYEVLRVKRNASPTEIKTAYRRLAKVYHPDAASDFKDDSGDFIEIHNAYATLSDPAARAMYDVSLSSGLGGRSFGYSPATAGRRTGFYTTSRRWETDQCW